MLPIIDYGGIAIVIAKVTAIGNVFDENETFYYEVYLTGKEEPVIIGFSSKEQAEKARSELLGVVAQYYYIQEFGPDFDIDEFSDFIDEDINDEDDNEEGDTEKH